MRPLAGVLSVARRPSPAAVPGDVDDPSRGVAPSEPLSEYEYDYEDGEEYDYGSDNDGEAADDLIEIENAFYEGDDSRQDNPQKALELFQKVVSLEAEKGPEIKWRFKALEHLVRLHFELGEFDHMLQRYKELLTHVSAVTRNESSDSVNGILDTVSVSEDLRMVSEMYETTLSALREEGNERMWFNTYVKLAKVYLQIPDYGKVQTTIDALHDSCKLIDGRDDPAKGNQLLEVYGITIQLSTATNDSTMMKEVYPKITDLNASVEDPRIMGVIREQGGKMYMTMGNWGQAYNEFYEGFRNYQEAGNPNAKVCLKYVVLANMLDLSDINPFAAREAKVFQEEKEIVAMMDLRMAYEGNDLAKFEHTLHDKRNRITDDPFVMTYLGPLRQRIRESVLLHLCRPYKKITMTFMARELNLKATEVEALLIDLILDRRLYGKIDQIEGYLLLEGSKETSTSRKHDAMERWSNSLRSLTSHVVDRVNYQ
eukprot:jgi/Undpi1/13408/HiC_scaffold_8.g03067.m1